MDLGFLVYIALGVCIILVMLVLTGIFFTVDTQTVAIVERFGKFNRIAHPGLQFKLPLIERSFEIELSIDQINGSLETKTADNVFVTLPYTIQYQVNTSEDSVKNSFYLCPDEKTKLTSFLNNILLGHIPETDLDEVFTTQPAIAKRANEELQSAMARFGYDIIAVLITDIIPDETVKISMNRINAEVRNKAANIAQGDAEYVLAVRRAEADAEVKRLEGVGIAKEREAIAEGWSKSLADVTSGADLTDAQATFLLLFTNYIDMMKAVGETENTTMVFMPSGPEGLANFQQTMTNTLLSLNK